MYWLKEVLRMWYHIHSFPKETQYIFEVAFLLQKSVKIPSRPYVSVTDPGAPGKMDELMLHFFWKRVDIKFVLDLIKEMPDKWSECPQASWVEHYISSITVPDPLGAIQNCHNFHL